MRTVVGSRYVLPLLSETALTEENDTLRAQENEQNTKDGEGSKETLFVDVFTKFN